MGINHWEAYRRSFWDWSFLDGCFRNRPRVKVMDIDGTVTHSTRHFLVLETKDPKENLPPGQYISFEQMLDTDRYTVFVIWGKRNFPERMNIYREDGTTQEIPEIDLEGIRRYVSAWWDRQEDDLNKMAHPIRNDHIRWQERQKRRYVGDGGF